MNFELVQEWHNAWQPGLPRDVVFTIPEGAVEGAALIVEARLGLGMLRLALRWTASNGAPEFCHRLSLALWSRQRSLLAVTQAIPSSWLCDSTEPQARTLEPWPAFRDDLVPRSRRMHKVA